MALILRGSDNLDSADIVKDSTCESDIAPYNKGFKNYIINGNFDVWQRGTSQTSSGYGSDDRWQNTNNISTKTHSLVTCTDTERALFNAKYFSRTVVSSVGGINSTVAKRTHIEGVTALAGKSTTLSFWAKADGNKKLLVESIQQFDIGNYVSAISPTILNLTNTWTKFSVNINFPSIIGKTITTNAFTGIRFWFDVGSDTANQLGATTMIQQSGTFDIAQVQLEEGSIATPFEQRPVGLELSLCQRYYERVTAQAFYGQYNIYDTNDFMLDFKFAVQKRVVPSVTSIGLTTVVIYRADTIGVSAKSTTAERGNNQIEAHAEL